MDKLRVAVIGTGAVSQKYHIPGFQSSPYAELVAICDVDPNRAQEVANRFHVPRWVTDWHELLDDRVDAVSICTPNRFHAEVAIAAAKAGKHVLCEKPIAMTNEEANAMVAAAEENGVTLMVEFPLLFDPGYCAARDAVQAGLIGEVLTVHSKWAHPGPRYYSPSAAWFYSKEAAGGGALLDLGIHCASYISSILGDPVSVQGLLSARTEGLAVDENATLLLAFPNGKSGIIEASWTCEPVVVETIIQGTQGRIRITGSPAQEVVAWTAGAVPGVHHLSYPVNTGSNDGHFRCVRYFAECAATGKQPEKATGEYGRRTLAVCLAGEASHQKGCRVQVSY